MLVEQRGNPVHRLRKSVCALRISNNHLYVAVLQDGAMVPVAKHTIPHTDRKLVIYMGQNHTNRIPPKDRMQLRKAGFIVS